MPATHPPTALHRSALLPSPNQTPGEDPPAPPDCRLENHRYPKTLRRALQTGPLWKPSVEKLNRKPNKRAYFTKSNDPIESHKPLEKAVSLPARNAVCEPDGSSIRTEAATNLAPLPLLPPKPRPPLPVVRGLTGENGT